MCHPPKKVRRAERGPSVQIKAAHNDSYLHTFRLYQHLHIQKFSAIFPCQLSVCLHVYPCIGKVVRMWQQCVRRDDNSSAASRVCVALCASHV